MVDFDVLIVRSVTVECTTTVYNIMIITSVDKPNPTVCTVFCINNTHARRDVNHTIGLLSKYI